MGEKKKNKTSPQQQRKSLKGTDTRAQRFPAQLLRRNQTTLFGFLFLREGEKRRAKSQSNTEIKITFLAEKTKPNHFLSGRIQPQLSQHLPQKLYCVRLSKSPVTVSSLPLRAHAPQISPETSLPHFLLPPGQDPTSAAPLQGGCCCHPLPGHPQHLQGPQKWGKPIAMGLLTPQRAQGGLWGLHTSHTHGPGLRSFKRCQEPWLASFGVSQLAFPRAASKPGSEKHQLGG